MSTRGASLVISEGKTMKRLWIVLMALGIFSYGAVANDYHAGSEFARGLKNSGIDTLKNTNPANLISNYTANPSESEYYGGVTAGAATGLENAGMNAMTHSEAGKTTSEVVKNRPPDKLNLEAPFLKPGIDMREEATVTAGKVTVPCQDVTLDKTEFTTHQCERTPAATLACTRTAKITWEEVDGWENQTIVVQPSDFSYFWHNGPWSFSFKSPVAGTIQSATLALSSGFLFNQHVVFMNTTFQMLNSQRFTLNAKGMTLEKDEVVTSNRICFGDRGENCKGSIQNLVYNAFASTKTAKLTLTMLVTVKVKTPSPKIEWVEHCPFDKSDEVKIETQCTEAGGTKTVTVGEKNTISTAIVGNTPIITSNKPKITVRAVFI
ncbi:hypothetical protein PRJH_p019 (plasmid) [Providencia rustigianii]